jgi:hypothetical protein
MRLRLRDLFEVSRGQRDEGDYSNCLPRDQKGKGRDPWKPFANSISVGASHSVSASGFLH